MLEKMRQAAAEQAKRAADAASRGAAAAADKAGEATARGMDRAVVIAKDPATHAKAKLVARDAAKATAKGAAIGAGHAGRAVKSAVDKFNPATLAAIVMKATSIQEQANAVLRRNRSLYRIGGIEIGAAFPPSISFQIVRAAELELEEEALGILPDGPLGAADIDATNLLEDLDVAIAGDEDAGDEGDEDAAG